MQGEEPHILHQLLFSIPAAVNSLIDYADPYFLTAVSSLIKLLPPPPLGSLGVIPLVIIAREEEHFSSVASKNNFNAKALSQLLKL